MAENEIEECSLINMVTMDGWKLPISNEFEDASCYMVCPDRKLINFDEEHSFSIIDYTTSDCYVLNNTVKTGLSYKETKKLRRAMWHSKAEHLQRWLIKSDWYQHSISGMTRSEELFFLFLRQTPKRN